MNFVLAVLGAFVFWASGRLTGSWFWWLVALVLLFWEITRPHSFKSDKRLNLGLVLIGLLVALLFGGLGKIILGLCLWLVWLGLRWKNLSRWISPLLVKELAVLLILGYGLVCFLGVVVGGGVWVWLGWLGAVGLSIFLIPVYFELNKLKISWLETGLVVLFFAELITILYFLPLAKGMILVVFWLAAGWFFSEFKRIFSGGWTAPLFLKHLAWVSLITLGLFWLAGF